MWRIASAVLALIVATLGAPQSANAQKRVALVIGNSAYQHVSELANPKNDATDMAAALKAHGFQVIEGVDLDKAAFERKVRDFSAALKGAEAGLFFYAGHGLQVSGHNYLVPVDAKAESEDALDWEMLRVDVVHRAMERSTGTNILFLDACRDNPMTRNLARAMGTRSSSVGRGLATIESGVGTLISFSTQPGNVAADGTGRNSPFAGALLKHLSTSRSDLSAMLIAVRNDVMRETQGKQVPWEHSALTGQFYFQAAAQTQEPAKVMPTRMSEAAEAWNAVKDTVTVSALEAYITRFKDTFYAELARQRIDDLKKQQGTASKSGAEPANKGAEKKTALLQEPEKPKAGAGSSAGWRPQQPIKLIVPFAPNGPSDTLARVLAAEMAGTLGQIFEVQNVVGAGGTIGAAQNAKAQPDGHTIMLHGTSLATVPALYANPPFNARTAFVPIGLANLAPLVVVSSKDSTVRNLSELVAWIKGNPDKVRFAHSGVGTTSHLCALFLQQKLGATFTQIAFQGSGPALNALATGDASVMCDQALLMAGPIKGATVKAHAVLSSSRAAIVPDVPTSSEAGFAQLVFVMSNGLYAPSSTPKAAVDALNAALQRSISQKAVAEALAKMGAEPVPPAMRSPEAHAKAFQADIEQMAQLLQAAGIKPQ